MVQYIKGFLEIHEATRDPPFMVPSLHKTQNVKMWSNVMKSFRKPAFAAERQSFLSAYTLDSDFRIKPIV